MGEGGGIKGLITAGGIQLLLFYSEEVYQRSFVYVMWQVLENQVYRLRLSHYIKCTSQDYNSLMIHLST